MSPLAPAKWSRPSPPPATASSSNRLGKCHEVDREAIRCDVLLPRGRRHRNERRADRARRRRTRSGRRRELRCRPWQLRWLQRYARRLRYISIALPPAISLDTDRRSHSSGRSGMQHGRRTVRSEPVAGPELRTHRVSIHRTVHTFLATTGRILRTCLRSWSSGIVGWSLTLRQAARHWRPCDRTIAPAMPRRASLAPLRQSRRTRHKGAAA